MPIFADTFPKEVLKTAKRILLKGLFFLIALQILNQSIDIDYVTNGLSYFATDDNYDDIDSFSEFIVENLTNNKDLTSEEDDDSGCPQEKGIEKYDSGPLFCDQIVKPHEFYISPYISCLTGDLNAQYRVSKGHFIIFSPPPEA